MTVWVVRAGKYGERESMALETGHVFAGWDQMGDLSNLPDKDELRQLLRSAYSDIGEATLNNWAGQLWAFTKGIEIGDLVALPLKAQPAIAFGKVVGDYVYLADNPSDARHSHQVAWIGDPVPRNAIDSDLRFSFGATQTIFRVQRNDAENRLRAKLLLPKLGMSQTQSTPDSADQEVANSFNILEVAREKIAERIQRRFKGRGMEELVKAVLEAKGYEAQLAPVGADDGADILAGRGPMGFEAPQLCVQVKSGDGPVAREVLDQLQGVMQKFGAQHGLLVSWGGFKSSVEREARRLSFQIRLWNDITLIDEILAVYDRLPKDIQAELPLTQTWVLVEESDL